MNEAVFYSDGQISLLAKIIKSQRWRNSIVILDKWRFAEESYGMALILNLKFLRLSSLC